MEQDTMDEEYDKSSKGDSISKLVSVSLASNAMSNDWSSKVNEFVARMNRPATSFPILDLIGTTAINTEFIKNMSNIGEVIRKAMTLFSAQLSEIVERANVAFKERLSIYPSLKNEILPLAKNGWFISKHFGFSELDTLAQIAGKSPTMLGAMMAKLYREDISDHLHSIVQEYPSKEFVLKPAIYAHLRGEYSISIPVFFMVVDGIAIERAKRYVFHQHAGEYLYHVAEARLKELSERQERGLYIDFFDLVEAILWQSISEKLPLSYNDQMRKKHDYQGLNRHLFIHGEFKESDATEENSLKAFSFLSCVSGLLADFGKVTGEPPDNDDEDGVT